MSSFAPPYDDLFRIVVIGGGTVWTGLYLFWVRRLPEDLIQQTVSLLTSDLSSSDLDVPYDVDRSF